MFYGLFADNLSVHYQSISVILIGGYPYLSTFNITNMEPELIKDGDLTLAMIARAGDFKAGLNFYSQDQDFIQVGTWHYQKGQIFKAHNHLLAARYVNRTQEVIYLKSGSLRADFYGENNDQLIKSVEVNAGDFIICLAGGHGYEILADNTQVLEVKNGPYLGTAKDKRLIVR